jgi:hypothetical protein
MRTRWNISITIGLVAICGWGCHAIRPAAPRELAVERVEFIGDFTTNAWSYGRDAGNSIRMGNDVLWVFGDTFTWADMHCATAAWSTVDQPTQLTEPVDTWFGSVPFYAFSPQEAAYNESRDPPECCGLHAQCDRDHPYCRCAAGTDCTTRIALWPGDLLAVGEDRAVQLYEKVQIGSAPYDFQHLGTGIATVGRGDTAAQRPLDPSGAPLLLFAENEPNFLRAVRVEEDSQSNAYLYAVANRQGCRVDILLARVDLGEVFDRDAYRFWTGEGWSPSLEDAVPVLRQILGGIGSVTWNDHLGGFLSAFNDICTGGSELILRTAPRPEGPWSEPFAIDLTSLGATADAYAGQIHSALGSGRELVFTFYQPDPVEIGRVRLGRLYLR